MTLTPTTSVNPSPASVEAFSQWPDERPIVMVNLLRYAGHAGRAAYGRYGQVAAQSIASVGGSLIYLAAVTDPLESWDTVVLVYYPRPSAYLEMQNDPNYVAAISDRTAGLSARLLYPFALPDISGEEAAARAIAHIDEVLAIQLIRRDNSHLPSGAEREETSASTGGEVVFELVADGPGLVADGRWDELRVTRYSSMQHWRDDEPGRHAADTTVQEVLTLLTIAGDQ